MSDLDADLYGGMPIAVTTGILRILISNEDLYGNDEALMRTQVNNTVQAARAA